MLKIGAGTVAINGEIGAFIQGATTMMRAKRIRDDLEANALYLEDGSAKILLISCDLAGLPSDIVSKTRAAISEKVEIPERSIIIAATHTHSGPSVIRTSYMKPVDAGYLEHLKKWLTELAAVAVHSALPGKIGWGVGRAAIGFNRRCCWADGTHTMHGDTSRKDFTGVEGPDDHAHTVICAQDLKGNFVAVLQNNTTHPTCFYGADFFSADCPGESRASLRKALGAIPVLFFNGAFGDISIENQLSVESVTEEPEQKMIRSAELMTSETLRLIREMSFLENPIISHQFEDIVTLVRLPGAERLKWARSVLEKVDNGGEVPAMDQLFAFGAVELQRQFGSDPTDILPVHAIRIGDLGAAS